MKFSQTWRNSYFLCGMGVLVCALSGVLAQSPQKTNEVDVEPAAHAFDKKGTWSLHIRIENPKVAEIDVPGVGKKKVWYMMYHVYNLTGEPRIFNPYFELKTDNETIHDDEIQPSVQKAISEEEDPSGKLKIKNSVTISKDPIPVSKEDAFPRMVHGVAIWTDVEERAPKTNKFLIFITGLSDGWREDPQTKLIRRKTLQLTYLRLADGIQENPLAIRFEKSKPPEWIYRATSEDLLGEGKKDGARR